MKNFFSYFSRENSVRGASFILVATLTLSNILGLLRDRFLAKNILYSDLDLYFAAFRLPDTLFNLIALGAISAAFIPIFADFVAKKKSKEGFELASLLINLAAVLMILSASLFYFLMPFLIHLVVPNFQGERLAQAIKLSRILMLTPIFFSISYIVGGILNSYKRFFAYSLAPLTYNLSIIIGAILAPRWGLSGLAWMVVLGSILHLLIQMPALLALKDFHYSKNFDFRHAALRKISKLMIPRSLSLGANQVMLTVYTAIGSSLQGGAIAAFNFANNIQTVPTVILGNSFASAVFPTLAHRVSLDDRVGFARYLLRAIQTIGFFIIPSSAILILLRAQIVRLILGSGKVGWGETKMTALVLGYFSISLIASGLIPLLARAFFALKNTRLPMNIALLSTIFAIIIAYPLSARLSVAGLALAFSLGSFLQCLLLFFALARQYPELKIQTLILAYLRITVISLIMATFIWLTMRAAADFVDMTRYIGVLTQTLLALLVGGVIYFALHYLLDSAELSWFFSYSKRSAAAGDFKMEN